MIYTKELFMLEYLELINYVQTIIAVCKQISSDSFKKQRLPTIIDLQIISVTI